MVYPAPEPALTPDEFMEVCRGTKKGRKAIYSIRSLPRSLLASEYFGSSIEGKHRKMKRKKKKRKKKKRK